MATIRETFPEIETAKVRVIGTEITANPARTEKGTFTEADTLQGRTFSCESSVCTRGVRGITGADVESKLRGFVQQKKTSGMEWLSCNGSENAGRGSTRSCMYRYEVHIKIAYRPEETEEAE